MTKRSSKLKRSLKAQNVLGKKRSGLVLMIHPESDIPKRNKAGKREIQTMIGGKLQRNEQLEAAMNAADP